MLKKILILFSIIFLLPCCTNAIPAQNGQLVKVGISDNYFSKYYFQEIEVSATGDFVLIDKDTQTIIFEIPANTAASIQMKNNLFNVCTNGKETVRGLKGPIVADSRSGFLYIPKLERGGKNAIYRGVFEFTKPAAKDNLFSIINILDINSYLRGVVPNEMPVNFGLEALKAQAVAARNYVLKPREKNYHDFDVCDSVACQVYYGAATEQGLSDRAIAETENIVAMYGGELILALYSSTAGGHTENYENVFSDSSSKNFPGTTIPYLKGIPDNKNVPKMVTEGEVSNFYLSSPATFDNKSPYFRWTVAWDAKELEKTLEKTLHSQSKTGFVKPALISEEDFGTLRDIKVIKRGVSGKAKAVAIHTDKNIFTVQKELVIRRVFQKDNKPLPSANIVIDMEKNDCENCTNFVIHGGGYGHGVGMSQWGAGMMGSMGYSYDEILKHYYTGIQTTTIPVTLSNEPDMETQTVNFYAKKNKTTLVIENKAKFLKPIVIINSKKIEFEPFSPKQKVIDFELIPHTSRQIRVDLTKYIINGRNQAVFILPYSDNSKKSMKLYIELNDTSGAEK